MRHPDLIPRRQTYQSNNREPCIQWCLNILYHVISIVNVTLTRGDCSLEIIILRVSYPLQLKRLSKKKVYRLKFTRTKG